jgi:exopolyphosphatase/guanosine-5'-triphosphate,3'-diphosphate pyrophosphatase
MLEEEHGGDRLMRLPPKPSGTETSLLSVQSCERLAVIDLGSNSFRLVVFTAGGRGGRWWRRTDEIYQPVRIAEGMASTGRLGEKPVKRALAALEVFAHFCRASGLEDDKIDAVATSAIREAQNREEFLQRARTQTGFPIRVLSPEQEAYYGYLAAVNSTTLSDGYVMDLGGGSLQLVRVSDRREREWGSWRLGAVQMTERFLPPNGPAGDKQLDQLRAFVRGELEQVSWIGRAGDASRLVGLGGALRNLADAVQRAAGMPSYGVQGMVIEHDALRELLRRLANLPVRERALPGIKLARADVILAAASVLDVVLEIGGFDGVEVTESGLREGVFFDRYLAPREPRLIEDVRRSTVLNLAARYRMDVAHSRHVARLALSMFDQLAQLGLHRGDPRERELLWAACMLHDVGMSVDYDDHHKHSRYLILSAGLPGFAPAEVAIIAQATRYHRKDMPTPGPLRRLFGKGDRQRLDRCAALLRLAEDLERSRDQLVSDTVLTLNDGQVELRLLGDGYSAVPVWAASREGELFTRAFRRELAVRS